MILLEDFVIHVSIIYWHKNVKISPYFLLKYVLFFISSIFELLVFVFFDQVCQKFVNFISLKNTFMVLCILSILCLFYISLKILFVL